MATGDILKRTRREIRKRRTVERVKCRRVIVLGGCYDKRGPGMME